MFKKLVVLSRRLRKAAVVVLTGGIFVGMFLLLLWASHTTVQLATSNGHPWIGGVAVGVFWLVVIVIAANEGIRRLER